MDKHKYDEKVYYEAKVDNYSSFIMRNKGFEGSAILNYTFYTSGNNEIIVSCQFAIEFSGVLTHNSLSSSFGLTFKKVYVSSIDKTEIFETSNSMKYRLLVKNVPISLAKLSNKPF